ncbi:MAG: DNA internalization-related competence protein ComEC/Rec2 [Desulfovibrio sp.]
MNIRTCQNAPPGLLRWQVLFLFFVCGLLAGKWLVPAIACAGALWIALWLLKYSLSGLLCFIAAALGFGYIFLCLPAVDNPEYSWITAREKVRIQGTVTGVRQKPDNKMQIILKDAVANGKYHLQSALCITWQYPTKEIYTGQKVEVLSKIKPIRGFKNPGQWDYEFYWAARGVGYKGYGRGKALQLSILPDATSSFSRSVANGIEGVRYYIINIIQSASTLQDTKQGKALVQAILTGSRLELKRSSVELMQRAGLSHVLALSGLHLGFAASIGLALAWLVGYIRPAIYLTVSRPVLSVWLAAPFVLLYIALGGGVPSLLRAGCMFFFWGYLLLFSRGGRVLLDGLFFALLIILLVNPVSVFDMGLQFSAVAVAGIIILVPAVKYLRQFPFFNKNYVYYPCTLLAVSLAANIALTPLITWYFGTVAPNFLMNLFWLPLMGFVVMPLAFVGLMLFPMWKAGGLSLVGLASTVQQGMLDVVGWVDMQGGTPLYAVLRPLWPEILGFSLVCCSGVLLAYKCTPRRLALWGVGVCFLCVSHLLYFVESAEDKISVTMLDVGQGQSLLFEFPYGQRTLVDGGGYPFKSFELGKAVVVPFVSYGKPPHVQNIVMTHPDSDHSQGLLYPLEQCNVKKMYYNGDFPDGWIGERMRGAIHKNSISEQVVNVGDMISINNNDVLNIVSGEDAYLCSNTNDRSLVLKLLSGKESLFLATGDIERCGIDAVLHGGKNIGAKVLSVPHHGSAGSFSPELINRTLPEFVLCSSGYLNHFGFPSDKVQKLFRQNSIPFYSTSQSGALRVVFKNGEVASINFAK